MDSRKCCIVMLLLAGCSQWEEPALTPVERLALEARAPAGESGPVQLLFDQGLARHFSFDRAGAVRSFQEAIRVDPQCAMCFWGAALALGPGLDSPMTPERVPDAYRYSLRALELAAFASDRERDYILALTTRYAEASSADRTALDASYMEAMRRVAAKNPHDVHAATLYAEALMIARSDGALAPLEQALARHPDHPGANRLYLYSTVSPDARHGRPRVARVARAGSEQPFAAP